MKARRLIIADQKILNKEISEYQVGLLKPVYSYFSEFNESVLLL